MMFSRLYLGVHSPADIVVGGIVGCVILAYWIKIDSIVDRYISVGDNGEYKLFVRLFQTGLSRFHI